MGLINRKLNTTPILPSEVRKGNLFQLGFEQYCVTSFDGQLVTLERLEKDLLRPNTDVYDVQVVTVKELQPIHLWNHFGAIHDLPFKALGFTAYPLGVYKINVEGIDVVAKDCFFFDECVKVEIEGKTYPIWYVSELQNLIYNQTGIMLLDKMGRLLLGCRQVR